jgi:hypothetical protein
MKTLALVIAAAFCLGASPLAVSPAAAEYLFYRNSSVLDDHWGFGVPLNRLDRDDLAREWEHRRIRTRLVRGGPAKPWPSKDARCPPTCSWSSADNEG